MRRAAAAVVAAGLGVATGAGAVPDSVAWEGEDAVATNFSRDSAWAEEGFPETRDRLLGGRWLSNGGPAGGEEAFARWNVAAPRDGAYDLWARTIWAPGAFRWRFDEGPWHASRRTEALVHSERLAPWKRGDPHPWPGLVVGWHHLGRVELAAGAHDFELRLLAGPGESLGAGIDAFFLTRDAHKMPSGRELPPLAPVEAAPGDWFPAVFTEDPFSAASVIDMSHLVEAPAGQHGFLTRDGDALRFEDATTPVRLFGCGANVEPQSAEEMERRARYLRKHGINVVRQHSVEEALGLLRPDGTFDPARLERFDRWFAALKAQGIYMAWSLFYPHHVTPAEGYPLYDELPPPAHYMKEPGARSTAGLVTLEPALQDSQWRWARALLLHRNPHTGLRYVDDPALAIVEVHNEDSVFWHHPLADLADPRADAPFPRHAARLRARFRDWARERYGSDAGLRRAWGRGMRPDDSLAGDGLALYAPWQMRPGGPPDPDERARLGDFIRFLAELQRGFYERRIARLRELGFRGVTVTTAWRAGGPAADPANLWSDTAGDAISRHNYTGGSRVPGKSNHRILEGPLDASSQLARPGSGLLSIGLYQVEEQPFVTTEWTTRPPTPWKLESAPLVAFYGLGLQGWDASFHFNSRGTGLQNGWPHLRAYATDTPHYMGQFPALAFAVHHGHVSEAPIAAARRLTREALFSGADPLGQDFTAGGHDEKVLRGPLRTPPAWLALGRVTLSFGGGTSETIDPGPRWDAVGHRVRALTDELEWDGDRERVTVETARTQGVIGRPGPSPVALPGVTAEIETPFVSLLFTPLDDRPLAASARVLVTALARDRQQGARYSADGTALERLGAPPLWMEPVQATLRLEGPRPERVEALDVYGVPTGRTVPVADDGSFRIDGRYRSYYYEIRRPAAPAP